MKNILKLILIFIFIPVLCHAWDQWNVEMLSNNDVSGDYNCLRIKDDIAYCTNMWGLILFDISQPEHPEMINQIPTPGVSQWLCLSDTLLVLCDGYAGVRIYSLSDPRNPSLLSVCEDPPNSRRVDIMENLIYVTNTEGGFNIIDISDPYNCVNLSYYDENFLNTEFVQISGNYLYVGKLPDANLHIFNVSSPNNPILLNSFVPPEAEYTPNPIIIDTLLYICANPNLYVYSISNPEEPELLGQTQNEDHTIVAVDFMIVEDIAYLVFFDRFFFIDISDISQPRLLNRERRGAWGEPMIRAQSIDIVGNHAFLADGIGRMSVLNIENPRNPGTVWEYVNGREYYNIEVNGEYAYLVDQVNHYRREDEEQYKHLVSFNVRDPYRPELISEIDNLAYGLVYSMIETGNEYLYITSIGPPTTIGLVSIENPQIPTLTGRLGGRHPLFGECRGNYFYVSRVHEGISIYNIANPAEPEFIREYQYIGEGNNVDHIQDLTHEGEFLYATDAQHGLRIYRFNGPEELELISITDFDAGISGCISVNGGYVFANSPLGVLVISVDDPESPQIVDQIQVFPHLYTELEIDSGILYVPEMKNGIKMYSLEDPASPELIGYCETPGSAIEISVFENTLYVADWWDFGIYDISRVRGAWYLGLSEESHNYGEVFIDSLAEWSFEIINNSRAEREITDIVLESEIFSCQFREAFTLESGTDTTLIVTFAPQTDTTYTSFVTLITEDHELDIELSGVGMLIDDVRETELVPLEFGISSVQPNPFNSSCVINYQIDKPSKTTLTTFDITGRKVAELVNDRNQPGSYKAVWDADNATTGVYFVRLSNGERVFTRKLILVR
jgi:hypothetical protein